jgi:glutamyl-tRNA reductase
MELVLRHLQPHAPKRVVIANRSVENAAELSKKYAAEIISFSHLPQALVIADVVISATGSAMPIVTKSMLSAREKALCILDIAVPRDVDVAVSDLDHVQLYSIDDLKNIIQQNMRGREHAADKAREVIKHRSHDFMAWLKSLDVVATTISAYRKQIEDLCEAELQKSIRQLQRGDDAKQVLASFAHALTKKLLHTPSVQLRQAGFEGRLEVLQLAQELFAISSHYETIHPEKITDLS